MSEVLIRFGVKAGNYWFFRTTPKEVRAHQRYQFIYQYEYIMPNIVPSY